MQLQLQVSFIDCYCGVFISLPLNILAVQGWYRALQLPGV